MKKSISLSYINTALIIALMCVIISPIAYSNYKIYENGINSTIKNLLRNGINITEVIIEQQSFILKKSISDIARYFSDVDMEKFDGSQQSEALNHDMFYNDLDLIFIDKGNNNFIDLSTTIYDTKAIINALIKQNYSLEDNCILNIKIDNKVYSIILEHKEIINRESGRVTGKVFIGKIINDNFELLNSIKNKTHSLDVSFYLLGDIISTTYIKNSDELRLIKEIDNYMDRDIYEKNNKMYLKQQVFCDGKSTGLYLITSYKNDILEGMKEKLYNQIFILVVVLLSLGWLINLIMKRIVIEPIKRLVDFAHKLKNSQSIVLEKSYISEVNYIHDEIKQIIDELRNIKEQYSLAVDGSQDGLWDWNVKTDEVFYSKRFHEMLGFEDGELENTIEAWTSRISQEDYVVAQDRIKKHFKGLTSYYSVDYQMKTKDGTIKWIRSRARALFDENGKAYRMVGFHTDIDEIKKLEKLNLEKEKTIVQNSKMVALGEIITNIAHHWRQPLSVITTVATGLKLKFEFDMFDKTEAIKDLDTVNLTAQSLSTVIDNFSNIYSSNEKKVEFDINNVIDNKLTLFNAEIVKNEISVIRINNEKLDFYGYKQEFVLILSNILNNAIEVLSSRKDIEKRVIEIDAKIQNTDLYVIVRDNGGGVSREIKDRIFEPYFTTYHQSQGKGLGLYMANEIITRSFEGKIEFKNFSMNVDDKEFRGAEFTMIFPIKSKELE